MGDREGPGCGLCGSPAALSLDLWGAGLPFRTPKATVPLLGGIRRLLHPSGREKFGEESGRLPSPPPLAQRSESPGWPAHLSLVVHSVRSPSSAKQADLLRTDPGSVGPRGPLAPPDLGSVAPHSGEGQLPWVLNRLGEAPRTPLYLLLPTVADLRTLKGRRHAIHDSTRRGSIPGCACRSWRRTEASSSVQEVPTLMRYLESATSKTDLSVVVVARGWK